NYLDEPKWLPSTLLRTCNPDASNKEDTSHPPDPTINTVMQNAANLFMLLSQSCPLQSIDFHTALHWSTSSHVCLANRSPNQLHRKLDLPRWRLSRSNDPCICHPVRRCSVEHRSVDLCFSPRVSVHRSLEYNDRPCWPETHPLLAIRLAPTY